MKKNIKKDTVKIIVVALFIVIALFVARWWPTISDPEQVEAFLRQWESLGPVAVVSFIVLEVVIAPIPGGLFPIAVGALYGVFWGTVYTWIGNVIGSIIAFGIARKFGRPLVQKFLTAETIDRYNNFLQRNSWLIAMVYLVPLFPIDTISFVAGLSALRFRRFVVIMTLAFIPHLLFLNAFGDQLRSIRNWQSALYIGGYVLAIVIILYIREKVFKPKE